MGKRRKYLVVLFVMALLAAVMLCGTFASADIRALPETDESKSVSTRSEKEFPGTVYQNTEGKDIPLYIDLLKTDSKGEPLGAYSEGSIGIPVFSFPEHITVGQDIVINVAPVYNAVVYWINLRDSEGNRRYLLRATEPGTYTISGLYLDDGEYYITVYTESAGEDYSEDTKVLFVHDYNYQRISRTINIFPGSDPFKVYENAQFKLSSVGAEKFAVRMAYDYNGMDFGDFTDDYRIINADNNGTATYQFHIDPYDFPGYYNYDGSRSVPFWLEVKAFYEGRWTNSNISQYEIAPAQRVSEPVVTIASSMTAGEGLSVKIQKDERVSYYYVVVDGVYEGWYEENEFNLPDEWFESTDTYHFAVQAFPYPGYLTNGWQTMQQITVSGTRPAAPQLSSQKSQYYMSDEFVFTAEAANAESISFRFQYLWNGEWTTWQDREEIVPENNIAKNSFIWITPSTDLTKMRVEARALIGGKWSDAAFIEVTVLPPQNLHGYDLRLPYNLTEIEAEAFSNIDARRIYIPEHVTKIGKNAFSDNKSLCYVYIPASVQTIEDGAFSKCSRLSLVVVPGSPAEDYAINENIPYEYQ